MGLKFKKVEMMNLIQLEVILLEVSELTKGNDHTQARLKIAESILRDKKLSKCYESIECLSVFLGYMDDSLLILRDDLDLFLHTKLSSIFTDSIVEKIVGCL